MRLKHDLIGCQTWHGWSSNIWSLADRNVHWVPEVIIFFFEAIAVAKLLPWGAKCWEEKNNLWSHKYWTSFLSQANHSCCFIWRTNQLTRANSVPTWWHGNKFLGSCNQRHISRLLFWFLGIFIFSTGLWSQGNCNTNFCTQNVHHQQFWHTSTLAGIISKGSWDVSSGMETHLSWTFIDFLWHKTRAMLCSLDFGCTEFCDHVSNQLLMPFGDIHVHVYWKTLKVLLLTIFHGYTRSELTSAKGVCILTQGRVWPQCVKVSIQ